MDHDDPRENRYGREKPERQAPSRSGVPSEFPWEESPGTSQPAPAWGDQPSVHRQDAVHVPSSPGSDRGTQAAAGAAAVVNVVVPPQGAGNGMAVAGFVLSLVMWIPIPFLNIILWVLAVTFSSIGLSRAKKRGLPHRGLAIAGLCISTAGVVFAIVVILAFLGAIAALG